MKSKFLLFIVVIVMFSINNVRAQVTVGMNEEPEKAALLDLKTQDGGDTGEATTDKGGILLPRVALAGLEDLSVFTDINSGDADYDIQKLRHRGLTVYNLTDDDDFDPGVYIWDGKQWRMPDYFNTRVNFFYMPSFAIKTTTKGIVEYDLYDIYMKQFEAPAMSSDGAPTKIPFYVTPTDLYYYVTDYDETVFDITGITEEGVMTIDITGDATDLSYINIVFVVK